MPSTPRPATQRQRMIETIRRQAKSLARDGGGSRLDPRALDVMARIPRHAFVPKEGADDAYIDAPLGIGFGQTISQPFIVALMSSLARIAPSDRVLEVGTGSGYQTAVLAGLAAHVYSIEFVAQLAERAAAALADQDILNVTARVGDGSLGWSEHAPYDAIVVTAAPAAVPSALVAQLAPGGRLVVPVGIGDQTLTLIEKSPAGVIHQDQVIGVRFVPLLTAKNSP